MRGTSYAVAEIVWWMVAAGVIGVAIGWVLRGATRHRARRGGQPGDAEPASPAKSPAHGDTADAPDSASLTAAAARVVELEEELQGQLSQLAELRETHAGCQLDAAQARGTISGLQAALASREARIAALESGGEAAGGVT